MFNSGWGSDTAFRGIAILALLAFLSGAYLWRYQQEHTRQRQEASSNQNEQVYQQRQAACVDVTKRNSFPCTINVQTSEPSEKYTEYDLQAQQDMAEWAFVMFVASLLGVIVTGTATVYVALTLHEARRTTDVTRQIGMDQSRAYVQAETAKIYWGVSTDFQPIIRVEVSNTGQTPAHWFGYKCHAVSDFETTGLEFQRQYFHEKTVKRWSSLGIGQTLTFDINNDDVSKIISLAHTTNGQLRIDGVIVYRTFFDELVETEFSFFVPNVIGRRTSGGIVTHRKPGDTVLPLLQALPQPMMRAARELRTYNKVGQSQG
jgi:hypothetical protein